MQESSYLDPQVIELQERSFVDVTAQEQFQAPAGVLDISQGGTGAADATSARNNLSAAKSGANSDITSLSALTSITIGGGTPLKELETSTVSIDPGSIAAQTRGSVTFTITGAAVGDVVIMQPPGALNTGLVYAGCEVTGANTVTVYLGNLTGVPIDDGSQTWRYLWMDLT